MATKKSDNSPQQRWAQLDEEIRRLCPHLTSVLDNEEDFLSLLLTARDDGTTLAVLKAYGSDGGPMVCFGSGYGAVAALVAIDSTVQGGRWRPDKPWESRQQ